ncbi:MAG: tetratricopeptide repeat protein [Planctomycetota bacterium]
MRWGSVLLCSWPGLARLWVRGHAGSLIIAIGFAILLNLALVSTFLWPDSLGETFPLIAWPVIFLVWIASVKVSLHNLPDLLAVGKPFRESLDSSATLFNQAQDEYLKGHWTEARALLERRLDRQPRDVEARLMLATLFRHSRQMELALEHLQQLQQIDQSARWQSEIDRELRLIKLISNAESYGESEHDRSDDVSHRLDHKDHRETNQSDQERALQVDN